MIKAKSGERWMLLTGGAGFIGSNLANRLLAEGNRVMLFDNLSRPGVIRNVEWLRAIYGDAVSLRIADIRDTEALQSAVEDAKAVFHMAAQVAVTSSIAEPAHDFDVNARGTLNVLEAVRLSKRKPPVVYTSTNKVYGELGDIELSVQAKRYVPLNEKIRQRGVDERRAIDLRTPYGCSKGTGEQYLVEYARTYGLHAVALRMSCIYGPRQMGSEDQGWVAHFFRCAIDGEPVTVYGDGRQVRDVLYVDDLVDALLKAYANAHRLSGAVFNIGGGPDNTMSLLELIDAIERLRGRALPVEYSEWRRGDQRYFVSCVDRFSEVSDWAPRIRTEEGLYKLHEWVRQISETERAANETSKGASR